MPSTYTPIATQTLGSTTASVTFNSFSGYTDLILIANAQRGITGAGESGLQITFNGDTGSNYSSTLYYEPPTSTRLSNSTSMEYASGSAGDGGLVSNIIHIMSYSNTNMNKKVLARYGYTSGSNIMRFAVGLWRSNAAITSMTLTPVSGFASGSNFTLYGIKGA